MNQLLPIIRRVRRPLLERDTPPMVVGNVEPPKVDGASRTGVQTTGPGQELENIQQPTSNIEHPVEGPAEAGTANQDDAPATSIPTE